VGAAVYGLVHEEVVASFPQLHLLIYGSLLILIVLFEPDGIVGLLGRARRTLTRVPGGQAAGGQASGARVPPAAPDGGKD
jgi:branched-chain amino acid transport system permease protein